MYKAIHLSLTEKLCFFLKPLLMRLVCALLTTTDIDSRKISKYGWGTAPSIVLIFTCVYDFRFNFGKTLASILKCNLSKLKAQNPSNSIYDTYDWDWLIHSEVILNGITMALICPLNFSLYWVLFRYIYHSMLIVMCINTLRAAPFFEHHYNFRTHIYHSHK